MPRQNRSMDLIPGKIRKRGCSSSASSSSSIIQNYRFKRAILVGKRGGSSTPVPTWKLMSSRSPAPTLRTLDSSRYPPSHNGSKAKQAPVSARKLAATLWEINEMPSPSIKESSDERRLKKEVRARERLARSMHSGSLPFPPHLSDPSHSPVSERMNRSGTGSRHGRTPSVSRRLRLSDQYVGALDSASNSSLMEIESRSHAQTPTPSTPTVRTRLKDVSNALTTSKELLKIINRIWGHEERPSSSMSLISALHAELERARLQVNQLIREQHSDQSDINYLMKCFAEEKAAWESKEQKAVEAAIESVAEELEVERKLRRRSESLNKKLGRELAETKASLVKVVKELESEKRARQIIERVCDELERDVGEDNAEIEELKRASSKVCEEVEKEKEIAQLADVLLEGKTQMKPLDVKYQTEGKNSAIHKFRNQLEAFLGNKRGKEKGCASTNLNDDGYAAYLERTRFGSHQNADKEDDGEVDNEIECEENSTGTDLHSIDLRMDNNNRSYMWAHPCENGMDPRRYHIVEEESKGRRSASGRAARRSTSIQRSTSDGIEWGIQTERLSGSGDRFAWDKFPELDKKAQGKNYGDEMQGYKSINVLRDQMLGSKLVPSKVYASPTRQFGQPWPSRDPASTLHERPATGQGNSQKSRLVEVRSDGQNIRKSKR